MHSSAARWPGALRSVLAAAALALAGASPAQQTSPPKIAIEAVSPSRAEAPLYGRVELTVTLRATFKNPFDPDQVALDATVTTPSGSTLTVPGYYDRPFTRTQTQNQETLAPAGEPTWKVRLAMTERGPNRIILTAKDATGTATSQELTIQVGEPESKGFVRISARDPRYLELSDGTPFFPFGVNLAYAGPRGTLDYDAWVPALARTSTTLARLWLSPEWVTFALETKTVGGVGRVDLQNAWRLDHTLELLERHGMRAILVLESAHVLIDRGPDAYWDKTPHKRDNGGPLDVPRQFWTEPQMARLFRNKLRYLVARYTAFSSVAAWELFNEADLTRGYTLPNVRTWHERMSEHLRALDPYAHLVTTSFARPLGEREIDRLPQIDLIQTHHYGAPDIAASLGLFHYRKLATAKAHLPTVVTADRERDRSKEDPRALALHDALWVSIGAGMSGGAMPWGWQTSVLPRGLHRRFATAARFIKGIDWPGERLRPATPAFAYQTPPATPFYRDLVMENGPVSFGNTEYNLPRLVRIDPRRVRYGLPVSNILHGVRNRPSKHNPITFRMDLARPTVFDVEVGDVSGQGGARLTLTLDGKVVLNRLFADPNDAGEPAVIATYRSRHSVPIPAGHHVLKVENTGNDWMMASYRFRDLFVRPTPPLIGWATVGDRTAVAWVRHADRTWKRVVEQKRPTSPVPPTTLSLPGLAAGAWRAELWDTWTGTVLKTQAVAVGPEGIALVRLPEIQGDLAVKLTKAGRA